MRSSAANCREVLSESQKTPIAICLASSCPTQCHKSSSLTVTTFKMNQIFAKTRVFALSVSEETMNNALFLFGTMTVRRTDGQRDGQTYLLYQYQRLHRSLYIYATTLVKFMLSYTEWFKLLGAVPRFPTGALPLDAGFHWGTSVSQTLTSRHLT